MLYRNGENLKDGLIQFLTNKNNVTIFTPYIKSTTLKKLLNSPGLTCRQIIVRWDPKDIALGSSDLDVYNICKENDIALYINNRIHLKLHTNNFNDAFLGSANISERAISDNINNCNYEVCSYLESIDRNDRLYLYKIINESILVTDEIYASIKSQIPDIEPDIEKKLFKLSKKDCHKSDFLITKLPMIDSPILFWELVSGKKKIESIEQENCLCHDLALYDVNPNENNKDDFFKNLSNNFLNLPFIVAFLKEVNKPPRTNKNGDIREGLQFGSVKKWFSENTSTAPAPRPFELTNNIQIFYSWIEYLSYGKYTITIPGKHSQVITRIKH